MDIEKFNDELKKINNRSWGYGNEILYLMAWEPGDLTDKDKLSGAIWLIGRAYAASPQRRSYGVTENNVEYINLEGKTPTKCPIWPVRTQNDGREGFFDEIAGEMKQYIESDEVFKNLIKNQTAYSYDRSDSDIDLLVESIIAVLRFNIFLSKSLEKFDGVPENNGFEIKEVYYKVYCSNHISFASKFLHFYFPNRIFIIDNYARDGGKLLFNENKSSAFYDAPKQGSDAFEDDIHKHFSASDVKGIYDKIYDKTSRKPEIAKIYETYNERARNANTSSEDNFTVRDYIEHCIRSYLLGCHIKAKGISPINQIKYTGNYTVESMPRLTDSVFLNIKAPISDKVKDYYVRLKEIYDISYIK